MEENVLGKAGSAIKGEKSPKITLFHKGFLN